MSGTILAGLPEASLLAFVLLASLLCGAMLALLMASLLDEEWRHALHRPLAAACRAAPLLLPFALPVLLWCGRLYPWPTQPDAPDGPRAWWFSPGGLALRTGAVLLLTVVLGRLAARPGGDDGGRQRTVAGIGLLLFLPAATIGMQDWALSREEAALGGLLDLALVLQGSVAALALAALAVPAATAGEAGAPAGGGGGGAPRRAVDPGLERTLLFVPLGVLWLWFVQFLTAWMVDLPHEAGWYLRRAAGGWGWLGAGVSLPALLGAILLGILPGWSRARLAAIAALLSAQHLAHLVWVLRPGAPGPTSPLADAACLALALAALAAALRRGWRMTPPAGRAPRGGQGASHDKEGRNA
ncbi:hypothetical protein M0638_24330 [Roseomonas sp. NAR14]|uniref:Uncharacterized protein n=1 Tax=Roseomonas acroporae TaxID=2937791 RepID=A0A9X1YCA9_9PROT|nr:hypothetical protein [Roseomonas acroporae]MCK8787503.1 hypothetical protein [Roseomonas acroporae]